MKLKLFYLFYNVNIKMNRYLYKIIKYIKYINNFNLININNKCSYRLFKGLQEDVMLFLFYFEYFVLKCILYL